MDFDRSTQAKSWLFDEKSLEACRERAVVMEDDTDSRTTSRRRIGATRSFASGFHQSFHAESEIPRSKVPSFSLRPEEQVALVRFHAHQIQTLVGPSAILPELRTSVTVLSTAIAFFRRFYLSNSVLAVNPRKMAAACAFFAAKVEEERIEMGLLSHATAVVQLKVQNAPLCRTELRGVSIPEIIDCERLLMKGLNYQFRCHHPHSAMHALALDYSNFMLDQGKIDRNTLRVDLRAPSPVIMVTEHAEALLERATAVVQRALIFSDAPFLFAPGHIGFAAVAIALGSASGKDGYMGDDLYVYLKDRFSRKPKAEFKEFVSTVSSVIRTLYKCDMMDLGTNLCPKRACQVMAERAEEMKQVLGKMANIRHHLLRQVSFDGMTWRPRKRSRLELEFTPPRQNMRRKSARVTPVGRPHYIGI